MAAPRRAPRTRAESFTFWYLGVSSVALAVLVVTVVILLGKVERVVGSQHDGNVRQCQLANVSRQQDIAIWNRLLNVPPEARKKETPAQRQEVKDLERLVRVKDTPRDCNAAFSTKK